MIDAIVRSIRENRAATAATVAVVIVGIVGLVLKPDEDLPSGPPGPPPPLPVGFNNNAVAQGVATADEAAELISEAGGSVDRVQIDWVTLEPSPGEYDFDRYDEIYEADLERGVEPLFVFAYAPEWANGGVCPDDDTGCHAPPTPEHYRDAARTAAAIAERYPESAGIEIWNEPNSPYFWVPAADPQAYATLLSQCKAAIEKVNPDLPVLGGSVSSSPGTDPGSYRAADFLREIYALEIPDLMDVLSVHPYPQPGDLTGQTAVDLLEEIRDVRDAAGEERTPIWVTETGATTTGPYAVSEEDQETTVLALYEAFLAEPDVEAILVHTLIDPPRGPADLETGFGVLNGDQSLARSYCALSERWGQGGC